MLRLLSRSRTRTSLQPHLSLKRSLTTNKPAPQSRLTRLESRLPNFLRRYTIPLRTAPVSHITAFLLLHELTALLPLIGLTAFFHYTNWLPPYISEGKWMAEYTEKFGRYLRRKGWVSPEESGTTGRWWGRGEKGTRIVVEVATAYAITKVLLPVRLVISVWGTPWFARLVVLPVTGLLGRFGRRVLGRKKAGSASRERSGAAGTGAVGGGVGPKDGL